MTPAITGCAYFLDIDGTLVDLADAPSGVRLESALPELLEALYQSSGGAAALITGRSLADVDRLFPARHLPAAGQHGLERRSADGRVSRRPGPSRSLDGARRVLVEVVRRHPRLLLEDKGLSLALHYRRAPRLASFAHRVMRSLQVTLGDRYSVRRGKRVVELAPARSAAGRSSARRLAPLAGRAGRRD